MPLAATAGHSISEPSDTGGVFGYGVFMFVADDKKGGRVNQRTQGLGGMVGAETANWHGLSLKGAFYTTQDLGLRSEDAREIDAKMFDIDKTPYSLLGEAQVRLTAGRTKLAFGRQEFFSPLINSYERRIIPNLFEAYGVSNSDIPHTTVTLAYVAKMSGLDGRATHSKFRSMSQQAYTSLSADALGNTNNPTGYPLARSRDVGNRGVWVAGLDLESRNRIRLWKVHGIDTLNTIYLDGRLRVATSDAITLTFEAQSYRVAAVGGFRRLLSQRGLNASYGLVGISATWEDKSSGLGVSLSHNRFSGNEKTVTAVGNWGGYPEFVGMPYIFPGEDGASAIARSRLYKLTAMLDLTAFGASAHQFAFSHSRIDTDHAIIANTDIVTSGVTYRVKLRSSWSARFGFFANSSANSRYANDVLSVSLRCAF